MLPGFVRVDSRELRMCEFCTTTDQEQLEEDGLLKKSKLYQALSGEKLEKHKTQCAKWQEFKKKKDQQEKNDEACETVSSLLNQ